MRNVEVAFKFIHNGSNVPIRFKKVTLHLIFDVNFDLTRKSRYVVSGNLAQVPASMSCSIIVSRYSVIIMFPIAAFIYLDIKMCDIVNIYLNVDTRERLWFTSGYEWGNKKGCQVIIMHALYGLKSSGSEWKKKLYIISGTPFELRLVLERTTVYTLNWKMMNMEMNITATSLYTWTVCCVFSRIPINT